MKMEMACFEVSINQSINQSIHQSVNLDKRPQNCRERKRDRKNTTVNKYLYCVHTSHVEIKHTESRDNTVTHFMTKQCSVPCFIKMESNTATNSRFNDHYTTRGHLTTTTDTDWSAKNDFPLMIRSNYGPVSEINGDLGRKLQNFPHPPPCI